MTGFSKSIPGRFRPLRRSSPAGSIAVGVCLLALWALPAAFGAAKESVRLAPGKQRKALVLGSAVRLSDEL